MKKYIFGLITGLLIAGSAVYAANYLYKADEVSYDPKDTNWNVDNVDSAIKELYNKISDANSALLALKNTNIAKAVGANGDTFTSVINKLGEITNQGNKSFTVSNTNSITIPAGYYNGQGTINVSGLVPAPTGTFTPTAHGTQIDMGANNTYRYINTTNVWNQAVAAADARANANSTNYQAGYNAGKSAATIVYSSYSPSSNSVMTCDNCGSGAYAVATETLGTPSVSKSGSVITVSIPRSLEAKGWGNVTKTVSDNITITFNIN